MYDVWIDVFCLYTIVTIRHNDVICLRTFLSFRSGGVTDCYQINVYSKLAYLIIQYMQL